MFLLSELQKITSHLYFCSIVIENFHYNHVLNSPNPESVNNDGEEHAIKEVQENHESKEGCQTENVNNVNDFPLQHDGLGRVRTHQEPCLWANVLLNDAFKIGLEMMSDCKGCGYVESRLVI